MTLDTSKFGEELQSKGFRFFSGVPCSHLKPLINFAVSNCNYISAANEGDALAVCAGASLAGKKSVFLCQNSGLTNAISPLTSLTYTFQIPVLGFVSVRGAPGISDEPQHELMGQVTGEFLKLCKVNVDTLSSDSRISGLQIDNAIQKLEEERIPFIFMVHANTFSHYNLSQTTDCFSEINETALNISDGSDSYPSRTDALRAITKAGLGSGLVATTGFTGRELYSLEDKSSNFYMVGSMGCASSFTQGLALSLPQKRFICIDGDGAALMRLGNFTNLGHYRPRNVLHILLDNHAHDSTGGQYTVSRSVNFPELAKACGYPIVQYCKNTSDLEGAVENWAKNPELTFLYLRTSCGHPKDLGRPKITPPETARRFQKFLFDN